MAVDPPLSPAYVVWCLVSVVAAFGLGLVRPARFLSNVAIVSLTLSAMNPPPVREAYRVFQIPIAYIPYYALFIGSVAHISVIRAVQVTLAREPGIAFLLFGFMTFLVSQLLFVNYLGDWFLYTGQLIMSMLYSWLVIPSFYCRPGSLDRDLQQAVVVVGFVGWAALIRMVFFGYPDANPIILLDRNCSLFLLIGMFPFSIDMLIRRDSLLILFSALGMLGGIVFGFSRGAWIASAAALLIIVGQRNKAFAILRLIKAFLCLVVVVLVVVFTDPGSLEVLEKRALIDLGSESRRLALTKEGIRIAKERTLLGTGIGLRNYLDNSRAPVEVPARPHNWIVSYFAQLGLLGMSFLCLFFLEAARRARRHAIRHSSGGILGSLVAVMVAMLFNEYLTSPITWCFIGVSFASGHAVSVCVNGKALSGVSASSRRL